MILRSASLLTLATGLRIFLSILPALGGALVLPVEEIADVTLALAIVTPFFLASGMGIPQRISTGDFGAGRYDQLHLARLLVGVAALPLIMVVSAVFPMVTTMVILAFFLTRLFEGQAELSTAVLTHHDRNLPIGVVYGLLVIVYLMGLAWIGGRPTGRIEALLLLTVGTSFVACGALFWIARRHHKRVRHKARLLPRSIFEIRRGMTLGLADGGLSLVSYLPRYLLSAIGFHLVQGAFAVTQLLIRQFTILIQSVLFARGGRLLPNKTSGRDELDRFLFACLGTAATIGAAFCALYFLVRGHSRYETLILSELGEREILLSILVGTLFLLRFATWLLATRFLKGFQQLRIATWSTLAAVATAMLLFVSPTFEIALATDIVANVVIVLMARWAILQRAEKA